MEDNYLGSFDIYEDVKINESLGRTDYYQKKYPIIAQNNNTALKYMIKTLLNALNLILLMRSKEKHRIAIWENKFQRIIDEQSDSFKFIVFTNSLAKYKELKKNNDIVFFCHTWIRWIDKGFLENNLTYTNHGIKSLAIFLKHIKVSAIILGNDKLFIEKTFQSAGRVNNIPVIVIQHGIYNKDSFEKLKTSDSVEYFWTWSEYIKKIYMDTFHNSADVRVIGYPFRFNINPIINNRVLFIGNHYLDYNHEEGVQYIKIAKIVKEICEEEHLSFSYRPHPSESINSEYGDIQQTISNEASLFEDIANSKIIIGDVSSCMIEAALMRRCVIQIVWSERSQILLSDPLYSFSEKTSSSKSDIKAAIKKGVSLEKGNSIDSYYLYLNDSFKDDVHKLLLDIICGIQE